MAGARRCGAGEPAPSLAGERVGIVGESGSGKSNGSAMALMGMSPETAAVTGSITP